MGMQLGAQRLALRLEPGATSIVEAIELLVVKGSSAAIAVDVIVVGIVVPSAVVAP